MKNKLGWRKGFGFAQIMAMIIVVIPTTLFIITLLFDYWTAMQLDNRLKLMSNRGIMAINNASDLSSANVLKISMVASGDWAIIESLCPTSKPVLGLTYIGTMPITNETEVTTAVRYETFNHLAARTLSSKITSYSYNDQNGSFKLECN